MRSIRHVETAAQRGNRTLAFTVCVYKRLWCCLVGSDSCSHKHVPALWLQWESLPHRRSWSSPRWWTDSPPTQICLPAPVVASSGIPVPTRGLKDNMKDLNLYSTFNNCMTKKTQNCWINLSHSRSLHFLSRYAGCLYLFPALSYCRERRKGGQRVRNGRTGFI